ncbi:hypothetical protein AB0F11_14270 [Streptomyces sp. NPDC032472]|uniref:hypothetical protein n=1 Tax=Streptomyces sp. NPDC032472 TaxID=3155018 RepID=UPI0033DA037F
MNSKESKDCLQNKPQQGGLSWIDSHVDFVVPADQVDQYERVVRDSRRVVHRGLYAAANPAGPADQSGCRVPRGIHDRSKTVREHARSLSGRLFHGVIILDFLSCRPSVDDRRFRLSGRSGYMLATAER